MQRPRNSSGTSTLATLDPLFRLGLMLFSFAIVDLGVETVACAHVVSHSLGPRYEVVPVIPWLSPIPAMAYAVGTI